MTAVVENNISNTNNIPKTPSLLNKIKNFKFHMANKATQYTFFGVTTLFFVSIVSWILNQYIFFDLNKKDEYFVITLKIMLEMFLIMVMSFGVLKYQGYLSQRLFDSPIRPYYLYPLVLLVIVIVVSVILRNKIFNKIKYLFSNFSTVIKNLSRGGEIDTDKVISKKSKNHNNNYNTDIINTDNKNTNKTNATNATNEVLPIYNDHYRKYSPRNQNQILYNSELYYNTSNNNVVKSDYEYVAANDYVKN